MSCICMLTSPGHRMSKECVPRVHNSASFSSSPKAKSRSATVLAKNILRDNVEPGNLNRR